MTKKKTGGKRKPAANSRKKQKAEIRKYTGMTPAEINRLTEKERNTIIKEIITPAKKKKQQRATPENIRKKNNTSVSKRPTKVDTRPEKLRYLIEKGIDPGSLTPAVLDKIKISDVRKDNVSRETYPNLFPEPVKPFSLNDVKTLENGQYMFLAFRDYANEKDFLDLLQRKKKWSNKQLLNRIKALVNTPPSYSRAAGRDSSGAAGDYEFIVGSENAVSAKEMFTKAENTSPNRRSHSGDKAFYQILQKNGSAAINEISGRQLLLYAVCVMENVTENDRINFYNEFYYGMRTAFPEMLDVLPEPVY